MQFMVIIHDPVMKERGEKLLEINFNSDSTSHYIHKFYFCVYFW